MPTKSAVQSLTFWGILFTAACAYFPGLAGALHLADPGTQKAITDVVGGLGTFAGLVITAWGRVNATQAISGLFKAKPAAPAAPAQGPGVNSLLAVIIGPGLLAAAVIASGFTLSGCATGSTLPPSTVSAALGSITAAVNAHPAATDQARQDAEVAFVVATDGVESLHASGLLAGVNLTAAKSDLETAYKVLSTGRLALTVAGAQPSAALLKDVAASDATFSRVDAELAAS